MDFIQYDYNQSVYDNVKNDIIAKTNWGNKFTRYYKKHQEAISSAKIAAVKTPNTHPFSYISSEDETLTSIYEFKTGLDYILRNDELPTFEFEEKTTLINDVKYLCSVYDLDSEEWSIERVVSNSYIAVAVTNTTEVDDEDDSCEVDAFRFNLMIDEAVEEGVDSRYKGRFFEYGVGDDESCYLEPMYNEEDTVGLSVYSVAGVEYGHYVENTLNPTYDTITDMFGVEDLSVAFRETLDADYADIEERLLASFKDFALDAGAWDDVDWDANSNKAVFVFSLAQYLEWMELNAAVLGDYIYEYENNRSRLEDDVKLLDHIGIIDDLTEKIDTNNRIRYIWLSLQKQFDESNPPKVPYTVIEIDPISGEEVEVTKYKLDPAWVWWERDEFAAIRRNFHKFYLYCDVYDVGDGKIGVVVNESFLNLPGKKVYDLVGFFIDVDAYIVPKKKKWWQKLLEIVLFVVGIIFVLMSAQPAWLKLVLIANSVLEYTGNGSLTFSVIAAVLSLGYNIYSVNFGSLTATETIKFAVTNINTIGKIYGMYDQLGLIDLQKELDKFKSANKTYEDAIEYIYTYAYSQYDELYNVLYNFDPKYANAYDENAY
jgi:hypothetical protein